jgi:hypothetical protein
MTDICLKIGAGCSGNQVKYGSVVAGALPGLKICVMSGGFSEDIGNLKPTLQLVYDRSKRRDHGHV